MKPQNPPEIAGETAETVVPNTPSWPAGLVMSKPDVITVSVADDLAIVITENAFEQLFGWTYSTATEISCLGCVTKDGNRFIVERFYLVKQSCTCASTELDHLAVAELIERLIKEGKSDEVQRIKCWAHSHPNMKTFWSSTDNNTCKLLASDYLVSVVVSDNFAIRGRIDFTHPVHLTLDNVPVLYKLTKNELSMEKYAKEVKDAVQARTIFLDEPALTGTQQGQGVLPHVICSYCGGWHTERDCPFINEGAIPGLLDEDFLL